MTLREIWELIPKLFASQPPLVALKYQDEDGDEVTANTEEEATMVVFEESITRLKVDLTYYYCSNLQLEDDRVL